MQFWDLRLQGKPQDIVNSHSQSQVYVSYPKSFLSKTVSGGDMLLAYS